MSRENVELVRWALAAFAEKGVEEADRFVTTDVVIYSIPEWPDDPEYYGREGFRKLGGQRAEHCDDFALEGHEVRDAGDSVVALLEITGRVKGSDTQMTAPIGAVYEFTDDLVSAIRYFSTWQGALEAAGLTE